MKPRQLTWKWLLVGLGVVVVAGLALLLSRQLGTSSDLRDRVAAALSAWTGGTVTLTEPMEVTYFPPALRGGFVLTNASRLPAISAITAPNFKVMLDFPELLMGRIKVDALRLGRPAITLKDTASQDETAQSAETLLIAALTNPPVGALRIRNGTIKTASGERLVNRLDVRIDARGRRGALDALGSFTFNGETVAFSIDSGKIAETEGGSAAPVTLKVTSEPVTFRFSGTVRAAEDLEGEGEMETDVPDGRRFLNWVGFALPAGESLKDLAASGTIYWDASTLTFDDGTFSFDGNAAVGLLALTAAAQPRVDGTLAFETLVLDPYLGRGGGDDGPQGKPFDWVLLKYIDADLRISAAEVMAAGLKLGRGGFTLTAKNGTIASEIGELDLCGGEAAGRMGLDLSNDRTEATLVGTLSDITVATCLEPFALGVPLTGVGSLKLDVSTGGGTQAELVRGLVGDLQISAKSGTVPIDFPALAGGATPPEEGWSRQESTPFDKLDADCSLSAGHIWCQSFRMQTPKDIISGSGGVDVAKQTLDWDLSIANPVAPLSASQLVMETPPRVTVRGSLIEPQIEGTNPPTLGDGSPKTNSDSRSATPN